MKALWNFPKFRRHLHSPPQPSPINGLTGKRRISIYDYYTIGFGSTQSILYRDQKLQNFNRKVEYKNPPLWTGWSRSMILDFKSQEALDYYIQSTPVWMLITHWNDVIELNFGLSKEWHIREWKSQLTIVANWPNYHTIASMHCFWWDPLHIFHQ